MAYFKRAEFWHRTGSLHYFKRAEFWHRTGGHKQKEQLTKERLPIDKPLSYSTNWIKMDVYATWCSPSGPHFSSEMLKAPDVLRRVQKALLAAGHPVDEFGHPRPTA